MTEQSQSETSDSRFGWGYRCHGIGIEVRGPQVYVWVGNSGRPVVFDEAMDVADEIREAAARACDNAVEEHTAE